MSLAEIQLLLIRLYLGLDFIPHFSEKLFEGPGPRDEDVAAFAQLGVPSPSAMVILAGLCELAASLGLTFGVMTRVAALGTAAYLVFATVLGHHDEIGFMWVLPGGGWEFPAMWAFLCGSFVLTGGGRWSVDALLRRRSAISPRLRWLFA